MLITLVELLEFFMGIKFSSSLNKTMARLLQILLSYFFNLRKKSIKL